MKLYNVYATPSGGSGSGRTNRVTGQAQMGRRATNALGRQMARNTAARVGRYGRATGRSVAGRVEIRTRRNFIK